MHRCVQYLFIRDGKEILPRCVRLFCFTGYRISSDVREEQSMMMMMVFFGREKSLESVYDSLFVRVHGKRDQASRVHDR